MIKAIETVYNGYRFRSRLEARWAVFLDGLGVRWEYEPEGFDLGKAGWYLPDFKVEGAKWLEIKPFGDVDLDYLARLQVLSDMTRLPVAYVLGEPWPDKHDIIRLMPDSDGKRISSGGWTLGLGASIVKKDMTIRDPQGVLQNAYIGARQARFEHGQVGAPSSWSPRKSNHRSSQQTYRKWICTGCNSMWGPETDVSPSGNCLRRCPTCAAKEVVDAKR